ncbi:hypothetical protein [Pseudoduganella sp.]|uniref:hypothetical protein n=1 Tax=Pseudoduganella sp. TaxID=1880898 RepID=UPI0035B25E36
MLGAFLKTYLRHAAAYIGIFCGLALLVNLVIGPFIALIQFGAIVFPSSGEILRALKGAISVALVIAFGMTFVSLRVSK